MLALQIFLHVSGPIPRLFLWCSHPLLPTELRPSRKGKPVGTWHFPYYSNFSMGGITELQSFSNVQTHGFARHPDCSHHSQLDWASVAFTSEHLTARYLTAPRIC